MSEKKIKSNCECCAYYYYDDEQDCYCCEVNLDEDEMCRFLSCSAEGCPYFIFYDEYDLAKKQ
ncbi:MAG: hypothetical protein E7621_07225 [Ruminococcaceae bacterium]|nr:hypothetical protein [Oscillospiraceae bacterium]